MKPHPIEEEDKTDGDDDRKGGEEPPEPEREALHQSPPSKLLLEGKYVQFCIYQSFRNQSSPNYFTKCFLKSAKQYLKRMPTLDAQSCSPHSSQRRWLKHCGKIDEWSYYEAKKPVKLLSLTF